MPAVLNDMFYPILLMGFEEPLTPAEVDTYLRAFAQIASEGLRKNRRHVVIVTTNSMSMSAASRKMVAAGIERLLTQEQVDTTFATFMPVNSAVVRGFVTAFQWISPDTLKSLHLVASLGEALDQALLALVAEGPPFTGDELSLRRVLGLSK